MGRGRVQLKRIDNKISRQVTFSKRRTGLLKKAHETSVLCDVDVGLILFNSTGKLFQYSSESSMAKILERYERHCHAENHNSQSDSDQQENWSLQCPKLTARIEVLQNTERQLMGEGLNELNLRQLQTLEQQVDTALKRIRAKKNQLMNESISELQKKERKLQEENNKLLKKVKENEKALALKQQMQQHMPPLPSLTIGISQEGEASTPAGHSVTIPPWMLRHMNE